MCGAYGITRQAFYRYQERSGRRQIEEEFIVSLVRLIRRRLHTCGGRNLWRLVQRFLRLFDCKPVGRDRFFGIIRSASLWVRYPKRRSVKTTYSRHGYAVAPNRFSGLSVTAPKQVFVADITYIPLRGSGQVYLFLLTDAYSRMIVGHYVSNGLGNEGAQAALRRARKLHGGTLAKVIHHSDRGSQYCCHEFLDTLKKLQVQPSMTDADHCAQNALAERINGMLKKEYGCDIGYESLEQARAGIEQAVELYNYFAIHGSLKGRTPAEVHFGEDHTIERWAAQLRPQLPLGIAA